MSLIPPDTLTVPDVVYLLLREQLRTNALLERLLARPAMTLHGIEQDELLIRRGPVVAGGRVEVQIREVTL